MAKGFKDEDGKFHPIEDRTSSISSKSLKTNPENSNPDSKRANDLKEQKQRFKQLPIWKYDDADEELKQKILDNWRNKYSAQDTFYAQDDGILYSKDQKIVGYEIFNGNIPKYWDVGSGHEYIQFELDIKDNEKFKKAFGITDSLWNKIDVHFENERENNTQIYFTDVEGNRIDLEGDIQEINKYLDDPESKLAGFEFINLMKTESKFNDLIDDALINLRGNYEAEFEDENIIATIKANEYDFDEDGNIT